MRINKHVALASGLSRRAADAAISEGRVLINGQPPQLGQTVGPADTVTLDGRSLRPPDTTTTIMLNKPAGYVVSRDGQGSATVYDLLPAQYHHLKPVGRLDKDSSGLLLLTDDGNLAHELTHPRYEKAKVYEVRLDKALSSPDRQRLEAGVKVEDYVSHLEVAPLATGERESGIKNQESGAGQRRLVPNSYFLVTLSQGKNRQIRKTFAALGYSVTQLHRTQFGPYRLDIDSGKFKKLA